VPGYSGIVEPIAELERLLGDTYRRQSAMRPRSQPELEAVSTAPATAVIDVRDLTYVYPGATSAAVSSVRFTVSRGEIFGLLGPSGAGKSTTQRVLTRQNRRFRGTVTVLSRKLESWDHSYYERIGVHFELPNHYLRLTGRENLDFFRSLYCVPTRSTDELLAAVGLGDAADERVGEYSKGMKVRLNFARAIAHDPSLLFLDEPTAGLDPVNAARIRDLIRYERERGKTIFLTTHNMMDVDELCDRVAFVVAGRMSVIDAPRNLKDEYGSRRVRVEYERDGCDEASAEFPLDGLGRNSNFMELLESHTIRSIHSLEASLDRVFAEVTGVQLARRGDEWR
jgi:fluoroquinolone transport system ATP-binding protein